MHPGGNDSGVFVSYRQNTLEEETVCFPPTPDDVWLLETKSLKTSPVVRVQEKVGMREFPESNMSRGLQELSQQ